MKEQITDTQRIDFIIEHECHLQYIFNECHQAWMWRLNLDAYFCESEDLRDVIDFALGDDE